MSQPEPIIINTYQLDNPIYIVLPMPTIMLQIPSIRIIFSHEFGNEHHSESNNKWTRYGHPQSEEDEIDEDYMNREEIEIEEIKQEEMIFQYPFNQQHDSNKYILLNDVNLNESSLSYLPEANIKDKIYGWEQFLIE
ncbi:unnamed protein product [Rotaria socialis]|uniref:Uncharacterized protein n=1 Tax=Rotaria socialis TaxID=392032 RepID=A0A818KLE2_9BILA|nr:unnamed protein product [Rotaria socialis]CAF4802133.1 unnamed protein product [Rotaria socialis]